MDRELAELISRELLACSGKLDQSVKVVESAVDQESYRHYRRMVGQIMGSLYIEVLREIFSTYPDLEPTVE